jgi:hypothetical protein
VEVASSPEVFAHVPVNEVPSGESMNSYDPVNSSVPLNSVHVPVIVLPVAFPEIMEFEPSNVPVTDDPVCRRLMSWERFLDPSDHVVFQVPDQFVVEAAAVDDGVAVPTVVGVGVFVVVLLMAGVLVQPAQIIRAQTRPARMRTVVVFFIQ